MKRYTIHTSTLHKVERVGPGVIISHVADPDSNVWLQGDEADKLEDTIEEMEEKGVPSVFIGVVLDAYFPYQQEGG